MAKLIMMQGLPASGKSTRAKEIVATGNYVRVNRDLLRTMLHFDKWSGRNEEATTAVEIDAVRSLLKRKHSSAVVDDCNLNPKNKAMWKSIAEECGAGFDVESINTPVSECILRDLKREKSVGKHVIVNMALQYELYSKPEVPFVLCDLDGTLFDITHRLQYASGETKDWDKFFAGIPEDEVRFDTVDTLLAYEKKGHPIVFVSARPERCREATQAKILDAFNGYEIGTSLIMRSNHDKRDDTEVKQDVYNKYFKGKYPIEVVIDDRPKVIRMWRENGLNVLDAGAGVEF